MINNMMHSEIKIYIFINDNHEYSINIFFIIKYIKFSYQLILYTILLSTNSHLISTTSTYWEQHIQH